MIDIESYLREALQKRIRENALRALEQRGARVDFCSNDYLGFSTTGILADRLGELLKEEPSRMVGSTGSRLLSGNSTLYEDLEERIARYHKGETALLFTSGYDANIGLFSAVPSRTDTILYDQLVHASIRDGIRLSHATAHSFRHNDLADLERRMKTARGKVFVAVESVYSMDGDSSPLPELATFCRDAGAYLIVDEAHATGVIGLQGEGMVAALGLQNEIFARVHTFGKALGCHGAAVIGSETLRAYLINFSRPFIYTTALPAHSLLAIRAAYDLLTTHTPLLQDLQSSRLRFRKALTPAVERRTLSGESPIHSILVEGNDHARNVAGIIRAAGFDVRPILHPTVPRGGERLRVCVHAFNSPEQVDGLVHVLTGALV